MPPGAVDAVVIAAVQQRPGQAATIVLVKQVRCRRSAQRRRSPAATQFRPPVGQCVLEMPAGLIDGRETAAQAALRELHEETGYRGATARLSATRSPRAGVVTEESPVVFSDPGMSNANLQLVHVTVDPACDDPPQALDDGEFVDVLLFPHNQLLHHIEEYAAV